MSTIPFPESPSNPISPVVEILVPGIPGPPGPPGPGFGITIKGVVASTAALPVNPGMGDAYTIGSTIYVWNGVTWQTINIAVGPPGPAGPAGTVPIPTWVDATAPNLLAPGWATFQAKPYYSIDALTRVHWRGSIQWVGPSVLSDGTPLMTIPAAAAPSSNRFSMVLELSSPPRFYRVDVGSNGRVTLRYPSPNTTGQITIDQMSWLI